MTYNALALSAINSMNYLFLRYTFKWNTEEIPEIVEEELQNYLASFVSEPSLRFDDELREILKTELIDGEYCEGLTRREAYDRYALAIDKVGLDCFNVADYYVSLLDDAYYASYRTPKDHDRLFDRDGKKIEPGTMIVFDLSVSEEATFYLVKQIGHQLFIYRNQEEPFVNVVSLPPIFRVARATDNPDYIEGYGCPGCFSDDTTTLLASRENICNRCGLEFPLPEEEAKCNEDENTRYALCQLTVNAQVKAYINERDALKRKGIEPPESFSTFLEMYDSDDLSYDPYGNVKSDTNLI